MHATMSRNGQVTAASRTEVQQALGGDGFLWLDLDGIDAEASAMLLEDFTLHHLAVTAAAEFGHRPKIEDYDGFTYVVARGADPDATGTAEIHLLFSERFLVSVHRGDSPVVASVREGLTEHPAAAGSPPEIVVAFRLMEELVDSFFPLLDGFDERIDSLEDEILARPTDEQLGTLFDMKRTLIQTRKVITPQRDMLASVTSGIIPVPGLTDEGERYFRSLYDRLIRISDLVDSYRDLLSGTMDTHLSVVSNRLNVVMKQLTVIATIFLPLSFLTGFFGQNFGWLVVHLTGLSVFLWLGLGSELVAVVLLLLYFWRKGWLGGSAA
jgi:magnesium transporter